MKQLKIILTIILIQTGSICSSQNHIKNIGTGEITANFNAFNSGSYPNQTCILADGTIINSFTIDNKENLSYSESLKDNLPQRMYYAKYDKSGKKLKGWYRTKNLPGKSLIRGSASSNGKCLVYGPQIAMVINTSGSIEKSFYHQIPGSKTVNAYFLNETNIRIFFERDVKGKKAYYQTDWNIQTDEKNKKKGLENKSVLLSYRVVQPN